MVKVSPKKTGESCANCFVCLKCFDLRYFEFKPLTSGQAWHINRSQIIKRFLFVTQCNVEFVLQLQRGLAIPRRILGTCDELLRSIFMLNHHFNNRTLMCIEVKQAWKYIAGAAARTVVRPRWPSGRIKTCRAAPLNKKMRFSIIKVSRQAVCFVLLDFPRILNFDGRWGHA